MQIYNLDFIKNADVIPDASIDILCTDPPYMYLNHHLDEHYNIYDFAGIVNRKLKKDAVICMFGRGLPLYRQALLFCGGYGFEFKEEIVWDKVCLSSPVLPLARRHELCIVLTRGDRKIQTSFVPLEKADTHIPVHTFEQDFKRMRKSDTSLSLMQVLDSIVHKTKIKKKTLSHGVTMLSQIKETNREFSTMKKYIQGTKESSVIRILRPHKQDYGIKFHETQKPVRLMERILKVVYLEGDTVLDPFCGSGSTLVASYLLGLNSIGFEINKTYFEKSQNRLRLVKETKVKLPF